MPELTGIQIRPMTAGDIDDVLVIEQASFPSPWNREHFFSELESSHSFPYVAVDNGGIVGYLCLMSLFEEAQILDVAVDPCRRGRGIAKLLMDHAIRAALKNKAEVLSLEVRASNIAAITLYESCGFVRSGLRKNYYDGREDAVLMEKKLIG